LTAASAAATGVRVGGVNRYDTARLAALANFPAGSANAILATGENFPDGLAASGLAGALGAPLLLTPTAALAAGTVSALAALHVHTVQIVGGPAAVSPAVIAQLTGLGYTVPAAVAGATRYDTAAAMATAAASSAPVGTVGGKKTAIVATGANFPDALASGAAAYFAHIPILLTNPTSLSPQTSAEITSLGITNVLITGGLTAVSAGVETSLKALAGGTLTTTRLAGATRFETSVAIATFETNQVVLGGLGMSVANVVLASGLNFPDALVGAEFKSPIVLNDTLPPSVAAWLGSVGAGVNTITALGGTAVISDVDLADAVNAASPSAGTAIISAVAGGTSFTVTFSATVNPPDPTNFTLNNAALPGGSAVHQTGVTSYIVTLGGAVLVANDVIALNNANLPTNSLGQPVAPASFTVPASAAPSLMNQQFFVTTNPGPTAISLTFSKPVAPASLNPGTVILANNVGGGTINFGTKLFSTDGTTVTLPTFGAIKANATLQITNGVTDRSVPPLPLANPTLITAQPNTVPPMIQTGSANEVTSARTHGSATVKYGLFPTTLTLSAKPNGPADGALGGLYSIQFLAAAGGSLVVTSNTVGGHTTFQITPPTAGVYPDGPTFSAALNANTTINTFFVANGTGTDDASLIGPVAAHLVMGGSNTYAVTAVFSKPVTPVGLGSGIATAANWVVANPSVGGASDITGSPALGSFSADPATPSAVSFTATATSPTQVVVHGTSTLTFNGVANFARNVMTVPATVSL
jgi:putative cell wall-binding protein